MHTHLRPSASGVLLFLACVLLAFPALVAAQPVVQETPATPAAPPPVSDGGSAVVSVAPMGDGGSSSTSGFNSGGFDPGFAPSSHHSRQSSIADRASRNHLEISGSRPRGDRPATGQAVMRPEQVAHLASGSFVTSDYFWDYYLGFGCYGVGCYYYDPYWLRSAGMGSEFEYEAMLRQQRVRGATSLRLVVKPRAALVYVDGLLAGPIDRFDGIFQSLKLAPGAHTIEIRAVGYEPLVFYVRAGYRESMMYEGKLQPIK